MIESTFQQKLVDLANVMKSFIGSTFLSMPFAFQQSGIVLGVLLLLIIALLNDYCMRKVIKCKDIIIKSLIEEYENIQKNRLLLEPVTELLSSSLLKSKLEARITLGHIAKYACGNMGYWSVTICLLISQFGFCTGYIVFIGNTLCELVSISMIKANNSLSNNTLLINSQAPKSNESNMLIYMLLVPGPLCILFSLMRTVRNIGWISIVSNLFLSLAFICILEVLIDGFTISSDFQLFNIKTMAVMFGILTGAFEGVGTLIPVETSMIGNRQNYSLYLGITMFLLTVILGGFGIVGNLKFGLQTKQIILQNFEPSVLLIIIKFILIVSVACTYPLQMYPIVEIVEVIFFEKRLVEFEDEMKLLNSHRDEGIQSDLNYIQNEILAELSVDEIDRNIDSYRRMSGSSITKLFNYQSSLNSTSTNSIENQKDLKVKTDSQMDPVHISKQIRMIRIIYESNIEVSHASTWKRNCIRVFIVLLQLGLAILMRNNFAYLVALIGALGSSFLSYILPPATEFQLTRSTETRLYYKIFNLLIIIFGVCGSISALVVTITKIVKMAIH